MSSEETKNLVLRSGVVNFKRVLLWCMLASCVLFLVLSAFAPSSRQESFFPFVELCDYRVFIEPSMSSGRPYFESKCNLRSTCYPPIAYVLVDMLANDKGSGWDLSPGEMRLLASIAFLQVLGIMLIVFWIPSVFDRTLASLVILFSPAMMCSLLRGNPSGWSIALVCVFLYCYNANSTTTRFIAALSLGLATALKLAPCIFGVLYLADGIKRGGCFPWKEIAVSALSALLLIFVPFGVFGGFDALPQWIRNANAHADYFSLDNPLWGFVPFVNNWFNSGVSFHPAAIPFAWATRVVALLFVVGSVFTKKLWHRLLYVGAAVAFITLHDYGGAYLVPAFVAWICDEQEEDVRRFGVCRLLECVAWFFILTPLQIPNPCFPGSLNAMLQNESLFVLISIALFSGVERSWTRRGQTLQNACKMALWARWGRRSESSASCNRHDC